MTNLASWIRHEHQKVEQLSDRLRESIAVIPRVVSADWLDQVRARFEHFRAHLHQHMALEECDGYMAAVVERVPSLAGQVNALEREHRQFARLVDDLHRALGTLEPHDRLLIRDCCHRLADLLNYVEYHETQENNLVEVAFTDDIGTKD